MHFSCHWNVAISIKYITIVSPNSRCTCIPHKTIPTWRWLEWFFYISPKWKIMTWIFNENWVCTQISLRIFLLMIFIGCNFIWLKFFFFFWYIIFSVGVWNFFNSNLTYNSETYVKCFANILPGAPKSLKSLRFSRQIVLCMHRTLASLLRISSSSGVWKFAESLNLPLTHENFCRAVRNSWFILAILPSQQERNVSSRWVNFEVSSKFTRLYSN